VRKLTERTVCCARIEVITSARPREDEFALNDLHDTTGERTRTRAAIGASSTDRSDHSRLLNVRRALAVNGAASLGHTITPVHVPNGRSEQQLSVQGGAKMARQYVDIDVHVIERGFLCFELSAHKRVQSRIDATYQQEQ
jgi:hypothetical protein